MSLPAEIAIKSSVVLAAALACLPLLRRQSAATRHWFLATAILLAGVQPILGAVLPALRLPAWSESHALQTLAPPPIHAPASRQEVGDVSFVVDQESGFFERPTWLAIVGVIWAAGALAHAAVITAGLIRLRRLRVRAKGVGPQWLASQRSVGRALALTRPVQFAITTHPGLLATYGVRRVIVLLPAGAADWREDRLQAVVAHELAHAKRCDWLVQLGAGLLRAFYWFNPLFWMACARLRQESEQACDDVVLRVGIAPTTYATHLIELARTLGAHRPLLPAPSAVRPSTLHRRVRAMLNTSLNRRPAPLAWRCAMSAALLALALPIAAATQPLAVISGTLRDPSGRVLPQVPVRLSALGANAVFDSHTDSEGRFEFPALPGGDYLLAASHVGFASTRLRVTVNPGDTLDVPVTLPIGAIQETINVRGDRSVPAAESAASGRRASYVPKPCTPAPAGGQIVPPMKLRDVRPVYPQDLIEQGVSGAVLLQARIGRDGRVLQVEPLSGAHTALEEAAINAVSQWEFSPTLLNCDPVEVRMFVSVSFSAQN